MFNEELQEAITEDAKMIEATGGGPQPSYLFDMEKEFDEVQKELYEFLYITYP